MKVVIIEHMNVLVLSVCFRVLMRGDVLADRSSKKKKGRQK